MNYFLWILALIISMVCMPGPLVAKENVHPKVDVKKTITRDVPATVVFRKIMEPREGAFTILIPRGWQVLGGIFRVDPNQAGGTMNSIEAKCDIAIASDARGTVMLRRLPKINYADGPMIPFTHGPGMNYNGGTVVRMPTVENYLLWTLRQMRPSASDIKLLHKEGLPKLVDAVRRFSEPLNRSLSQVGVRPPDYHAGFIIVEYTEGDTRFKELLYTILIDARASTGAWSNDLTTAMRAPVSEADHWKPVMDIVANSVQMNPQWVAEIGRAHV